MQFVINDLSKSNATPNDWMRLKLIGPIVITKSGVTLDGRDLRDYDVESFRSILGIVEQDVFLFDGTIAQNIAYARRYATPEEIRAAAEAANAAEFIDRMPDGMQTVIGERGVRLSGGQRQRLAIARAILKDPPILILDEATSALDPLTEERVNLALEEVMKGRTSFIIAHRLATVRNATRILVLNNGRIVEAGSHNELIRLGGFFSEFARVQLAPAAEKLAPLEAAEEDPLVET
jgi:ATP-binding cassette subfamily B protein/subfamily B ATP-binding cassette protein MsbA